MGLGGSCLAEQVRIESHPSNVHRQQTPINPEHPMITFASTQVTGNPEAFQITGNLTIMGQVQLITVSGGVAGGRIRRHATVAQTWRGLKPPSAFPGPLRLADPLRAPV